ncbi:MAG: hypothetical protein K2X93_16595 [Candidatus Obscuribacterales bacterium]|nr:hypothetical protein [Candidatus Obscuribacterales bacterium]
MTQRYFNRLTLLFVLSLSIASPPARADWVADAKARTAAARARFQSDPVHQELRRRLHDPSTQATHARLNEQMKSDPHFQDFEKRAAQHRLEYYQKQNAEKSARVASAGQTTQSPGQCVRAFQSAVYRAKTFNELLPYFSEGYKQRYTGRNSLNSPQEELTSLKSAYAYPLGDEKQAKIVETIKDGEAVVWLEGKNLYDGKWKGVSTKYRLIPESRYWRIDGVSSTTGLTIIEIPKL